MSDFKEYSSLKEIKKRLKDNDEISVDQVKGYNRRISNSPFIREHLDFIEELLHKIEDLEQFDSKLSDERLNEIMELEAKVKSYRETNDELCYENDEINRKWAEDNERNGDILSEQQEQIIGLEEENKKLKEDKLKLYKDYGICLSQAEGFLEEISKLKEQLNQINQN